MRRKPNWPAIGLVAVVLVAVLYLFIRLLGAIFGGGGPGPEEYLTEKVTPIVKRSTALGDELRQLLAQPGEVERATLQKNLVDWRRRSNAVAEEAEELEPPEELRLANGFFVTAMSARAAGFKGLADVLLPAIGDKGQTQVAVAQIVGVNRDFLAGDRSYAYFVAEAEDALKKADVKADVPPSVYFPDPAGAEAAAVEAFLKALQLAPGATPNRDLAVLTVALQPKPTGSQAGVPTVIAGGEFAVVVTVKNAGNQAEPNLVVTGRLRSETSTKEQSQSVKVKSLEPNKSVTVTIKGLTPTPNAKNILTVTAGPLPGEKKAEDNTKRMTFLYKTA